MTLNIINPPSSGGVGVEVDPNSLHLTGGTMGVNANVVFPSDGNGNDSLIGAWGFGVEDSNGNYSTVEPTAIVVSHPHIFAEQSITDTVTIGSTNISSIGNNTENRFYLDCTGVSGIQDDSYSWSFGVSGLTFSDGSIQTTAGGVGIQNNEILNENFTIYYNPDGTEIVGGNVYYFNWGAMQQLWAGASTPEEAPQRVVYSNQSIYGKMTDGESVVHTWEFGWQGLTFDDGSTQTTAGIPEAPIDGNAYVRKDGAWVDITTL